VVITEAEESIPDQLRRREKRYAVMMGLRALCLVLAVLVSASHLPFRMLWVGVCIVGMVVLPWMAVLVANDRLPKKSSQFRSHLGGHPRPDRALPPAGPVIELEAGDGTPPAAPREARIVDHRPDA
jgi:Flp pilus assembly protein TadB